MKTESELTVYKNTKSSFVDNTRFEPSPENRIIEREAFIRNEKYVPELKYPRLNFLFDDPVVEKQKSRIYEAVLQLDASKENPGVNAAETELYARSHEKSLKKLLIVEAAKNLYQSLPTSTLETNRESFSKLNESLYGKLNTAYYLGIISTEKDRLNNFHPESEVAKAIKTQLEELLGDVDSGDIKEEVLLDENEMRKLQNYVSSRYADVLNVVPNTPDDEYYDVNQCAEIMNNALEAGGLAQFGWKAIENPKKLNPATNPTLTSIFLPSNLRRNSLELRRLIIHEQEVHARRAQNGKETGIKPIKSGTANYADAEEGFGVMLEAVLEGDFNNASFNRARNRYITAGLALGADGQPRDAREVYEILWRTIAVQKSKDNMNISEKNIQSAKNEAYSHIENAYRGTQFWMKGVIYTKLKVYYEGLARNAQYFKDNIDCLDQAFDDALIGKYNHTDASERQLVKSLVKV